MVYFSDLTSLEQHCIVLACLHCNHQVLMDVITETQELYIICMHVSKEAPVQAAHLINASL